MDTRQTLHTDNYGSLGKVDSLESLYSRQHALVAVVVPMNTLWVNPPAEGIEGRTDDKTDDC